MATDTKDPFNWKMPNRSDLMSLDTIKPMDAGYSKFQAQTVRANNLQTSDILGSQPLLKQFQYTNKESFINRNEDIQGSKSRQLIRSMNKTDYQLKNDDIKGTKTKIFQFTTTREASSPLNPVYKLQSFQTIDTLKTKFIKDSIVPSDIEGAKPLSKIFPPRSIDIYTEIEGSKSRKRIYDRNDEQDTLNVKDINVYYQFISKRQTNPLSPEYQLQIDDTKRVTAYGKIEGSQCTQLHPVDKKGTDFNLQNRDINGAWADSHANRFLKKEKRKDFRNPNNNDDIQGSKAHSLKIGLRSNRVTNPLQPTYQLLGEKEALTCTGIRQQFPMIPSVPYNKSKEIQLVQSKQGVIPLSSIAQKMDSYIKK